MVDAAQSQRNYSIEEWLRLEKESNTRHEFHDGEVYAMSGGTYNHGTLVDNAQFAVRSHFDRGNKNCRAFSSEFKLQIEKSKRYVYPDTLAVCGDVERSDNIPGAILNPIVVVEVLSKSSENYDMGKKYYWYSKLPSVQEYLMVVQDEPRAILRRRHGTADIFQHIEVVGLEATIELQSIGLQLPMQTLYRYVDWPSIDK